MNRTESDYLLYMLGALLGVGIMLCLCVMVVSNDVAAVRKLLEEKPTQREVRR